MKLTQEILNYMGDDELHRRYRNLNNLIRGGRTSEEKRHELEIEYCYICREIEIRRARHVSHERWLRDNPRANSGYYDNNDDSYTLED
jgi:hypothetical protein